MSCTDKTTKDKETRISPWTVLSHLQLIIHVLKKKSSLYFTRDVNTSVFNKLNDIYSIDIYI